MAASPGFTYGEEWTASCVPMDDVDPHIIHVDARLTMSWREKDEE
jgi:hypothetical protein